MSAFKDLAKGGWHPGGGEKKPSYATSSSSSSSRFSNIKGADKVAGLLGKGGPKPSSREAYADHRSTPLSALQDPDSFGPPPKNYGSGGGTSVTQSQGQSSYGTSSTNQGGLGSSVVRAKPAAPARPKLLEEEVPLRPTGPFRPDTTGLSTANLPAPPVRRVGGFTPEPSAISSPTSNAPRAPPKLPPRLPPRQAAIPSDPPPAYSSPTPAANTGMLNTAATDRLARAGVSVPGFNIGGTYKPPPPAALTNPAVASPPMGGVGTTWAQKRAALETAQKLKADPSSVSFSDMKSSASTAKNFHDRHGEQVATGMRFANKFNSQVNGGQTTTGTPATESTSTGLSSGLAGLSLKKAAPPPPVKPSDLSGGPPPPVPLGSKPTFS